MITAVNRAASGAGSRHAALGDVGAGVELGDLDPREQPLHLGAGRACRRRSAGSTRRRRRPRSAGSPRRRARRSAPRRSRRGRRRPSRRSRPARAGRSVDLVGGAAPSPVEPTSATQPSRGVMIASRGAHLDQAARAPSTQVLGVVELVADGPLGLARRSARPRRARRAAPARIGSPSVSSTVVDAERLAARSTMRA